MRKIGLAALGIVTIIILLAVVFVATFDVNRYRSAIQSQLEKRLDRKVTLGNMHLSIFPPRFRAQNISISDDPSFSTQKPFVQAEVLDVSVKLLPLLKKSVQIDSLALQRPRVELIKNRQGIWNFASLGGNPQEAQPVPGRPAPEALKQAPQPGAAPAAKQLSSEGQFALKELTISDGEVAVTDQQAGSPRTVYDHIDATLRDFAPSQPFLLEAAAHLPGPGGQSARLEGKGGPIDQSQPANTPFHGTLTLKQVGLASLARFLNSPVSANTDGMVSGGSRLDMESGKLTIKGQADIQHPRFQGIDLGYPVVVQYDLTDDLTADLITIRNILLKLGSTPVVISGAANARTTPSQLDLNVRAGNAPITEAIRLAPAYGVALASGTNVTGTASANINVRGTADKPILNGTIAARDVQLSGKDVPQPVRVPAVNLTLSPAAIQSDSFTVVSGGTTMAAQLAIKQYQSNSPVMDARLRARNAQLPGILSIARAYGIAGADKMSGAGIINLDAYAAGPVKGFSSAQLMRALNGTATLDLNNVRYSGTDISHQLASIAGYLSKSNQPDQGYTNISKMTGGIVVKSGVAQTNDLQALLDIGKLGITGTGDLATQALNLRVTAVLSKSFVERLGGIAGISGLLNTALANNQGELIVPATVTGTFQNPRFAPDLKQIAQMKLKGLLPNSDDPFSAVSGILGGLLGQKGAGRVQQQPSQQPESPVDQILDIFRKKKPQQQQQQPQQPK